MNNHPLKILGIITARGGSKGIPRKNVVPLNGQPLISYMVEASNKSELLTRCIISTDDEEIATVAKQHGADVPFMRPAELAEDSTLDLPVLQHAVKWVKEHDGQEYDAIMMLHPTSPLCTSTDIDACINTMVDTQCDSVMSMVEVTDFAAYKLKKITADHKIESLLEDEGPYPKPRTASEPVYKRNAAIYLTRTDLIMADNFFGDDSRAYVMPAERSVDINTPFDILVAEHILKYGL